MITIEQDHASYRATGPDGQTWVATSVYVMTTALRRVYGQVGFIYVLPTA